MLSTTPGQRVLDGYLTGTVDVLEGLRLAETVSELLGSGLCSIERVVIDASQARSLDSGALDAVQQTCDRMGVPAFVLVSEEQEAPSISLAS